MKEVALGVITMWVFLLIVAGLVYLVQDMNPYLFVFLLFTGTGVVKGLIDRGTL